MHKHLIYNILYDAYVNTIPYATYVRYITSFKKTSEKFLFRCFKKLLFNFCFLQKTKQKFLIVFDDIPSLQFNFRLHLELKFIIRKRNTDVIVMYSKSKSRIQTQDKLSGHHKNPRQVYFTVYIITDALDFILQTYSV